MKKNQTIRIVERWNPNGFKMKINIANGKTESFELAQDNGKLISPPANYTAEDFDCSPPYPPEDVLGLVEVAGEFLAYATENQHILDKAVESVID